MQPHFDCRKGPLARCVWIRHAPEHDTLPVTLQHSMGDGTSSALLIRDLREPPAAASRRDNA